MTTIDTQGGSYKYPYRKQIFFTFPNMECITITDKCSWSCDEAAVIKNTTGQTSDDGGKGMEKKMIEVGMKVIKQIWGMRCQ